MQANKSRGHYQVWETRRLSLVGWQSLLKLHGNNEHPLVASLWMAPSKYKHFFKRQPYICFLHHRSCFRRIYNVAHITEKKVLENEVIE